VPAHPEGVKLKSFFWKKIMPYALLSVPTVSFWEVREGPIELDYSKIADLFRAKIAAKKKPIGAVAVGAAELQVLDMKRATSVGILMKKVNLSSNQVVRAIYQLDSEVQPLSRRCLAPETVAFGCTATQLYCANGKNYLGFPASFLCLHFSVLSAIASCRGGAAPRVAAAVRLLVGACATRRRSDACIMNRSHCMHATIFSCDCRRIAALLCGPSMLLSTSAA
jgi:hypothetical protein